MSKPLSVGWNRLFFWWCLISLPLNLESAISSALASQVIFGIYHAAMLIANVVFAFVFRERIHIAKLERHPAR